MLHRLAFHSEILFYAGSLMCCLSSSYLEEFRRQKHNSGLTSGFFLYWPGFM